MSKYVKKCLFLTQMSFCAVGDLALLLLLKRWLCVSGQKQMCQMCGWLKLNLKKCAVGKIKNTEGSAVCVGSVAVQLQYGLYVVGHLSKLAFHFMFIVVCLVVVVSSFRLPDNLLIPLTISTFIRQIQQNIVLLVQNQKSQG